MKGFLFFLFSVSAFSQDIRLSDYKFAIKDISKQGTTKESEYKKLNLKLVKIFDSICSNRAHVWAWDMKLRGVDSAKVFMFFTPKTSRQDGINWWYHTAPVVNEKGKFYVLDGGYPDRFKTAIALKPWLKNFNGPSSTCKELKISEEDLISLIFKARSFPEVTSHGKYNCYYKITPPGFWVPNQVAINLLGKNSEGRPMNLQRDEIKQSEVYSACLEASRGPLGDVFNSSKKKCNNFLRYGSQN